jgi:CRP-like cAMP-binding protein
LLKYNIHFLKYFLLEQYPALFQRVSKSTIAHYLGVSRETLSRLVKK